jgi:hypothetical protein
MYPKSRFPIVLAVTAVAAAVAAPLAAGGTIKRIDSTVTLATTNPFHGHVSSPNHACEVHRVVKVYDQQPGPDGLFGKTKTNRRGKWSIDAPNVNGNFYAKVTRREEGAAGTTYVCRRDVSPARHFGSGY